MDSLTTAKNGGKQMDQLEAIMVAFAQVLGASRTEARALAVAIAAGPDRPTHEREALARVRRAVLVQGSEDDADRAILATWLGRRDSDIGLERLPCAGPPSGGLPMPPQDLDASMFTGLVSALGMASRARTGRALRSDT